MKKHINMILAVLLSLLIVGCIGTGTITIKHELAEFVSSNSGMEIVEVDLTTNNDYNDHKDKIKSIDQVTVIGWLVNELPAANQAQIWIADVGTYSTPDLVRENATRVFVSPVISGNDSLFVNWADGLDLIENLPTLKKAAENGHFWIYGIAEDTPFRVRFHVTLIITLTAGL